MQKEHLVVFKFGSCNPVSERWTGYYGTIYAHSQKKGIVIPCAHFFDQLIQHTMKEHD